MNKLYMVEFQHTAIGQSLRRVGSSEVASIDKCSPRKFVVSLCLIYFSAFTLLHALANLAMYFQTNRWKLRGITSSMFLRNYAPFAFSILLKKSTLSS